MTSLRDRLDQEYATDPISERAEFEKGVKDGFYHYAAYPEACKHLPPLAPSAFAYYHGFRAGIRYAKRAQTTSVPMSYDRHVGAAWRRYEKQWEVSK